jgi:protein-S-isoprenylcysteine O-methyltransferase Ste14
VLYLSGLGLALVGHLIHPLSLPDAVGVRVLGAVPVAVAVLLGVAAERELVRAKTPVLPFRDASALVTTGPFRLTRNPIYLAFTLLVLGVALGTASWWPVITLPLVLVAMTWVIRGEERSLERLFGEEYRRYRHRVRRWL